MRKSNIYSPGDKRKINPDWFTDKVHMKDISSKIKSKEQDIYHVYFENGAKTKMHLHNGNQILIITKGIGNLEIFRKYGAKNTDFKIKRIEKISLKEGDIVHIPSNTLHTHGSSEKKTFSHIAINILPSKNSEYKTTWYESDFKTKVTKKIWQEMSVRKSFEIETVSGNEGTKIKQYFHPHNTLNGIGYSLAHFTLEPGKKSLLHKIKSSEVYYILEGDAILKVNEESHKLKKDDSVYVPPMSEQSIENTGTTNLQFLCIVEPAWKPQDEIILE